MGNALDAPVTEKDTSTGTSSLAPTTNDGNDKSRHNKTRSKTSESSPNPNLLKYGVSSMQGWRVNMEDAHVCVPQLARPPPPPDPGSPSTTNDHQHNATPSSSTSLEAGAMLPPDHALFCVFDGHGGSAASKFASDNFRRILCSNQYFQEYVKMIMPYVDLTTMSPSKNPNSKKNSKKGKLVRSPSPKILTTCNGLLTLALQHAFAELDRELLVKGLKEQSVDLKSKTDPSGKSPNDQIATKDATSSSSQENTDGASATNDAVEKKDSAQGGEAHEVDTTGNNWDFNLCTSKGNVQSPTAANCQPDFTAPFTGPTTDDDMSWEEDYLLEDDPGTTAVAVLITPHVIVCANLGDSRAVLCCSRDDSSSVNDENTATSGNTSTTGTATAKPLSFDHKPSHDLEKKRIEDAGGTVNFGRVDGELAVSRALGDFNFKNPHNILLPGDFNNMDRGGEIHLDDKEILERARSNKVSAVPDIEVHNRHAETDRFLVLACDGIWDVLSNQECVELISTYFEEGDYDLGVLCGDVLDICLKKGSRDNMTIVVVTFPSVVRARM